MTKHIAGVLWTVAFVTSCLAGSAKADSSLTKIRGEIDGFMVGQEQPYVAVTIGKRACVLVKPDQMLVAMLRAYEKAGYTYQLSIDPTPARCVPLTGNLPPLYLKSSD